MYANWNNCIRRARGEFVYIATSDDSMAPDCLEKLVAALTAHPDCDLAHCPLKVFDEAGRETEEFQESLFAESSGESFADFHVRRAPFDGLLHLVGSTVYISITQLLVRRSLFDRIGLFESAWGSVGDFNWDMRACLVANTVHVPDTWGGWRVHGNQATAAVQRRSTEHAHKIDTMIDHAIAACARFLPPRLQRELISRWSIQAKMFRAFDQEIALRRSPLQRRGFIARQLLAGSVPARLHVRTKAFGQRSWRESFPDQVRRWLDDVDFGPALLSETPVAGRT
jgi:hypothetical protein